MTGKVTRLHKRSKKVDWLTKGERRARLADRQEQWTGQWTALAKAFIEALLGEEIQELLGRPAHK